MSTVPPLAPAATRPSRPTSEDMRGFPPTVPESSPLRVPETPHGDIQAQLSARSMSRQSSCDGEVTAAPRFLRMQIAHDVNMFLTHTLEVHREETGVRAGRQVQLLEALALEQKQLAATVAFIQQKIEGCETHVTDLGDAMMHSHAKILDHIQKRQPDDDGTPNGAQGLSDEGANGGSTRLTRSGSMAKGDAEDEYTPEGLDESLAANSEILRVTRQDALYRFVTGHIFEFTCAFVILLNAAHSAVLSQFAIMHAIDSVGTGELQQAQFLVSIGYAFVMFYTGELLLRLFVFKLRYFTNDDWKWNVFDLILVLAGIYDVVWDLFLGAGSTLDVKWLRMLRLLKMMKMLRVIRVMHFFQELRVLVAAIQVSGKKMLWIIVMLLIILFVFAMCFLQGVTTFLNETPADEIEPKHLRAIQTDWATVAGTMLTLFTTITGGRQWADVADPLWSAGSLYYCMFLMYIAFTVFTVLNVITGIYVDAAMKIATNDYDTTVTEIISMEKRNQTRLREIFTDFDKDKDGSLTLAELDAKLAVPKVHAFFQAFQIEPQDAKRVFRMIIGKDVHRRVGVDQFLNGCIRLKGPAKSIDMFCLQADRKLDHESMMAFMDYVEDSMDATREAFRKMGYKQAEVLPIQSRLDPSSNMETVCSSDGVA